MVPQSFDRSSIRGGDEMVDMVDDLLNEGFEETQQRNEPQKIINIFDGDIKPSLLIEDEEEEELEWVNNKDAFPAIDFGIFPLKGLLVGEEDDEEVDGFGLDRLPAVKGRRSERRRRPRAVKGFEVMEPPPLPAAAKERRRCWHCEAEETPQWRAGPYGPKTLCNACGVRYKSGRLVPEYRPANSPTFSSEKHSNSHRKILEMRRKNGVEV